MELRVLDRGECEEARQWRNNTMYALRTPYELTWLQQDLFYKEVVCDRNAKSKYWGIWLPPAVPNDPLTPGIQYFPQLIGMCGLENIEWENGIAEISIIIDPKMRNKKYGEEAVKLLLEKGFNYMRLENIYGECYVNNEAVKFWAKIADQYDGKTTILPHRKYWNGSHWDSMYFNISKGGFTRCQK